MNSVQLVARLGRDPELRHTQSGKAVCNLRVAVSNGRDREATWLDVVCWDKTAELVHQYKRKGDQLAIEGRLQTREWEQDGQKRSKLEVVAFRVHFIGGGRDDGEQRQRPQRQRSRGYGGGYGGGEPESRGGGYGMTDGTSDADDSIPF